MIIVSQDRLKINENLELEVFRNSETGKFHIENRDCTTLGIYSTEERAKEVLQEITDLYKKCEYEKGQYYYKAYGIPKVYEMPEE